MSYIGLTLRPEQMAWFIYRNIAWSVSVAIHAFGRQSHVWLKLLRCHGCRGNNIINIRFIIYGDLIDTTVSKSDRGISLRGETYSVFCYADDLLIASTTSTGLQALIDLCDSYISQHGLRYY